MKDRALVARIVMMCRHLARSLVVALFFLTWGLSGNKGAPGRFESQEDIKKEKLLWYGFVLW
jgi:hypothetical protein